MKLWIFWGFDAFVACVFLYFFFAGLADGTVTMSNLGLWIATLALLAGVVGGSIWLRSKGRRGAALVIALILAVPGLLAALFFVVLLITNSRWN